MYRVAETGMWDDPKIRKLDSNGKLLFFYLFTNRHTHLSGIYYIPDCIILHETKIPDTLLDTLWDTLSGLGLAWRDKENEIVFVKSMMRYQGKGDKNLRAAAANIGSLHKSFLINKFVETYPTIKKYGIDTLSDTLCDRESIQEQEQEQNKELLRNSSVRSDSKSESSSQQEPQNCVLELPLKDGSNYKIHQRQIEEWKESFPKVDVALELGCARAWLQMNPGKRKTRKGIGRFVCNWMLRAGKNDRPARASPDLVGLDVEAKQQTEWETEDVP